MITGSTRILFLARRYPPSIGGIETHCYELHERLKLRASVRLVALRKNSLLHLIWFLPYCLWTTFWAVFLRRVDIVYFADGVAGVIAPLVRPFGPARFCITIYGLEMTYKNPFARFLMQNGAKTCNAVAVISENTKNITANSILSSILCVNTFHIPFVNSILPRLIVVHDLTVTTDVFYKVCTSWIIFVFYWHCQHLSIF